MVTITLTKSEYQKLLDTLDDAKDTTEAYHIDRDVTAGDREDCREEMKAIKAVKQMIQACSRID